VIHPPAISDASLDARLRRGLLPARNVRGVEEMARAACYSHRQFHRLAVQSTGETPAAYRRRLRLDRGAALLLGERATVLEVALETGWQTHESFTRAFRARFGVTPSRFRRTRGITLPFCLRAGLTIAQYAQKS
jgi:AraC-like DNA-binding protein